MKKVFVKGWVEDHSLKVLGDEKAHHSVPVRFRCEDGKYEWLWVRKNNVRSCTAAIRASRAKGGKRG